MADQATDTASAALLKYGRHIPPCPCAKWELLKFGLVVFNDPRPACSCGLDAALASLPAPAADTASVALLKALDVVRPWQTGKPPNEMVVEVEWEGAVIPVIAFYGRDGYHPHWRSQDGDKHWPVNAFARWRQR